MFLFNEKALILFISFCHDNISMTTYSSVYLIKILGFLTLNSYGASDGYPSQQGITMDAQVCFIYVFLLIYCLFVYLFVIYVI